MERIAFRGAALVLVAIIIGVVLLAVALDDPPATSEEVVAETTTTTSTTLEEIPAVTEPTLFPENPEPVDPSEIKVVVANGSGVSGAAGRATNRLNSLNYSTGTPTNTSQPQAQSNVFFLPGQGVKARQVAASLGITDIDALTAIVQPLPVPFELADIGDADVVVVLGGPDSFVTNAAS